MRGNRAISGAALLVLLATASTAPAQVTIPDSGRFVIDIAGKIDGASEQELERWLRELEQKTGAQVKVLTVPTIEGEDFFGFVQRHAELWKLGRKGKDNGALIVLAVKERKVRIQTGYGLEGALPDSWCGQVSREVFAPNFKKGRFSQGLLEGTVMVANRVAAEYGVQLSGVSDYQHRGSRAGRRSRGRRGGFACFGSIMPLFIILAVVSGLSRRGRYRSRWGGGGLLQGMILGSVLGSAFRHRGGGWGGGGFGGGGGGASW